MEENNNNNNNNNFRNVNMNNSGVYHSFQATNQNEKSSHIGLGKTVLLPFVSGVIGASIVVVTCVGIPSIRNIIFGQSNSLQNIINSDSKTSSINLDDINTKLVSLGMYSDTAVEVANKVQPSIVGIKVEYSVNSIFNRGSYTGTAEGSGVIISEDGYILTNNHIINSSSSNSFYELGEANKIVVTLYNDETEYTAKVIGTDEQTDLAVIKIEKTGLTAAELGNSDTVKVGEFSMAVGNPLGLQSTVTAGIISAVNREVTDSDGNTYVAIQTDAAINSGNSGGALVNSNGQVIGINTLKVAGTGVEGVGFAIPINSTKDIYKQLIQYQKVKRPYLGIGGINLTEELAKKNNLVQGIYVKQLEDFSAAEKAGIKVGDVIVKADGQEIKTMDELNAIKNKKKIGDTMTLTVNRNGKNQDIKVTLQEQP